jgi:hypothetical protein
MDIEQLKLVLEAVNGVTGSAYWVAILFIAKQYLSLILGAAIGLFAIIKCFSILGPLLQDVNISRQIRTKLNIGGGYCTSSEVQEVMDIIDKGMAANK